MALTTKAAAPPLPKLPRLAELPEVATPAARLEAIRGEIATLEARRAEALDAAAARGHVGALAEAIARGLPEPRPGEAPAEVVDIDRRLEVLHAAAGKAADMLDAASRAASRAAMQKARPHLTALARAELDAMRALLAAIEAADASRAALRQLGYDVTLGPSWPHGDKRGRLEQAIRRMEQDLAGA